MDGVSDSRLAMHSMYAIFSFVKFVSRIVALCLTVVWLPVSSHALLEVWEIIHHHEHHGDSSSSHNHHHKHDTANHAAADGLCIVSAAKVNAPRSSDFVAFVPFVNMAALLTLQPGLLESSSHLGLSPPDISPPELSASWKFSLRAALPVRAPSSLV
jgi:hypothetical protein